MILIPSNPHRLKISLHLSNGLSHRSATRMNGVPIRSQNRIFKEQNPPSCIPTSCLGSKGVRYTRCCDELVIQQPRRVCQNRVRMSTLFFPTRNRIFFARDPRFLTPRVRAEQLTPCRPRLGAIGRKIIQERPKPSHPPMMPSRDRTEY